MKTECKYNIEGFVLQSEPGPPVWNENHRDFAGVGRRGAIS